MVSRRVRLEGGVRVVVGECHDWCLVGGLDVDKERSLVVGRRQVKCSGRSELGSCSCLD